jgi:hypothetical protein
MVKDSVIVLKSNVMEEGLRNLVAKKPLFAFRPFRVTILHSQMVHYPYWCVILRATATQRVVKDQTLKLLVTVDALNGDVASAKKIPEGSEMQEESVPGRLRPKVDQGVAVAKAKEFALDLFMKKFFLLKEVSSEVEKVRLVYYPYWVLDIEKGDERFRRAVDAIHGEFNDRVAQVFKDEGC